MMSKLDCRTSLVHVACCMSQLVQFSLVAITLLCTSQFYKKIMYISTTKSTSNIFINLEE